jgi:hypothetical protein
LFLRDEIFYCRIRVADFNLGTDLFNMGINKIRTTRRLKRAQEGHSAAARELLGEAITALSNDVQLSFEERKFWYSDAECEYN